MASSAIFFFAFFLSLSLDVFAKKQSYICPATSCQPGGIEIRFPFRLRDIQDERCDYPGFNLSCINGSQVILHLPDSQDYEVEKIDYEDQSVVLKDPDDCLPDKLRYLNLLGSFFFVNSNYESFIFVDCPVNLTIFGIRKLDCLSDEQHQVLLTYLGDPRLQNLTKLGCQNWKVTIPLLDTPMGERVSLRWDQPDCISCELNGGRCGLDGSTAYQVGCIREQQEVSKSSNKFVILPAVMVPSLLCMLGIACYLGSRARASRHRDRSGQRPNYDNGGNNVEDISSPSSPLRETQLTSSDAVGLDTLTIKSYPKYQVGDDGRVPRLNDNICAICLSEYQPNETLRAIPKCGHYFHAQCIDEWLGRNASCPMCRNQKGSSRTTTASN